MPQRSMDEKSPSAKTQSNKSSPILDRGTFYIEGFGFLPTPTSASSYFRFVGTHTFQHFPLTKSSA